MRRAPALGAPVRTIRRDRVERVGDGEDPGPERDLLADEPIGIAVAVPALVVRSHDVDAWAAEERDAAEHLRAEDGVGLHQPPLGLGQRRPACAGSGRGCRSCRCRGAGSRTPRTGDRRQAGRASARARARIAARAASACASRCPSSRARSRAPTRSRGRRPRPVRAGRARARRGGGGHGRRAAAAPRPTALGQAGAARPPTPRRAARRRVSSSSGRNGFSRSASAPAAAAVSSTSSRPVRSTTRMSSVARPPFRRRQNSIPSTPGRPTSSTTTSGRCCAMRCLGLGGVGCLPHLDVHGFERRSEESTEPRVVIDEQQAHQRLLQAAAFLRRTSAPSSSGLSRTYPVRGIPGRLSRFASRSRSPARPCARADRRRRTGAEAGTARTSGRRDLRGARP